MSNLENETPLLSTLLKCSQKEEFCFVETHINEIIPIKDCSTEEIESVLYVKGYDYINNRQHTFPASNIKIVTTTAGGTAFLRIQKENFTKITEMCEAENIPINPDMLYRDVPVYQKIISMLVNKKYEEISLNELKDLWKRYIEIHCTNFENYILAELSEDVNDLYKSELIAIRDQLSKIKQGTELDSIKTKEAITAYWPILLMPSPCFVNYS
jgi:hypothetical protein